MYEPFVRDWMQVFSKEQVYVTRLEDYGPHREQVLGELTDFLELGNIGLLI